MSFNDLPDGCLQHILDFLSIRDVAACAVSCKRLCTIAREPLIWFPRLRADFGVDIKARLLDVTGQQVNARWIYQLASEAPKRDAIRFWGCFTNGGCDDNLTQYWVDNLFAPSVWESYCSALGSSVNCIGLLMEPSLCENADLSKAKYRAYLLERLRVPAGVIFGHGIVNLALIQQEQEFDTAVMERLHTFSLAELERLFLDFFMELVAGHTIGRLLLHGLQGEARERERINLNGVADRAEKSQTARNTNLVVHPANKHIQFDGKALVPCGVHGLARSIGIIERLTVCRAGHFSCPVLAGVIFLAHFDGDASRSPQETFRALQAASDSPISRAFDKLKDEKAVSQAVRKGLVPARTKYVVNSSGVYYNFAPLDDAAASTSHPAVGHMQPVAWFRFHNRRDHKRWAELSEPKAVWEGADNDLDIRRSRRENASTRGASPEHTGEEASSSAALASVQLGADIVNQLQAGASAQAAAAQPGGLAQFVGDVQQMAQAWLGGASHGAMQENDDSEDTEMSEAEDSDSEEEEFDEEGSPHGTKGRDTMQIELQGKWAGNLALVKLIDQEDLMHEWADLHDEPNIDINHVIFSGSVLELPDGVSLDTAQA